jgi:hypothetical protein
MIVNETCQIIWEVLKAIMMPNPSAESWRVIEEGFHKWNVPNFIRAIDEKHVIQDTVDHCTSVIRSSFSIVLLVLADATSYNL